nr:unnamed protein product [Digitaria exilis]
MKESKASPPIASSPPAPATSPLLDVSFLPLAKQKPPPAQAHPLSARPRCCAGPLPFPSPFFILRIQAFLIPREEIASSLKAIVARGLRGLVVSPGRAEGGLAAMRWWARAPAVLAAAAVLWLIAAAATGNADADAGEFERAFPIVEPDYGHTKLRLAKEGLEAIQRIKTPIAAASVIGPYRSGKSFLLNQLLSLSCDKGFGVGHMRDTKTKGIWVWGTPIELDIDGSIVSVLYLDTEGFESVGKSNVYDDRIFALATVLSSVLIYNLPETIREADISRLSFAVEIAEEFYGRF